MSNLLDILNDTNINIKINIEDFINYLFTTHKDKIFYNKPVPKINN